MKGSYEPAVDPDGGLMADCGGPKGLKGSAHDRVYLPGEELPTKCCHHRRVQRGRLAAQVQVPKKMLRVWYDLGSSFYIMSDLLLVPDTALALFSSVSSVYLWNHFAVGMSVDLTWAAVSLMLAFPLQNAIREAYARRENALQALMSFRAGLMSVYLANALWDWPGAQTFDGRWEDNVAREDGGRGVKKKPCAKPLSALHGDRVKELIFRILDALQDMLVVPRAGHARNEFPCGRQEKREVDNALDQGREAVLLLLGRLQCATEDMKAAGLPANEASRINQYNMFLLRDFESLWAFKTYYTPIGLRALLRVLIQMLPYFFGPYWLHIAKGGGEEHTKHTTRSLAFACTFSIMLTSVLIAMNNLEEQVENTFKSNNRDTIRVQDEITLCRRAIAAYSDDLQCHWHERMQFDWEVVGDVDHVVPAGPAGKARKREERGDLLRRGQVDPFDTCVGSQVQATPKGDPIQESSR